MDLPTYTNIWRIEKRLYKLYDFRLPAPLPITWIGVFVGITVPYVVFLIAVGLPFNHTLVWLYVLPPGVLTWLCTRPVIENKRLPELVSSQLRYIAEPRTWCRMAPFAEKDEILVAARVWHLHPPKARPKKAKRSTAKARSSAPVLQVPAEESSQPQVPAEDHLSCRCPRRSRLRPWYTRLRTARLPCRWHRRSRRLRRQPGPRYPGGPRHRLRCRYLNGHPLTGRRNGPRRNRMPSLRGRRGPGDPNGTPPPLAPSPRRGPTRTSVPRG